jgi:hypothetical protein
LFMLQQTFNVSMLFWLPHTAAGSIWRWWICLELYEGTKMMPEKYYKVTSRLHCRLQAQVCFGMIPLDRPDFPFTQLPYFLGYCQQLSTPHLPVNAAAHSFTRLRGPSSHPKPLAWQCLFPSVKFQRRFRRDGHKSLCTCEPGA